MATFPQRIARFFSALGDRISGRARVTRGPEESHLADLPGVPQSMVGQRQLPDPRTAAMLREWNVYESRLSPLAGPMRDRFALWNATNLTPETITGAQRAAVYAGQPLQWVELIDHIFSRDIDYASVTNQRVADVMRGRWTLRRAGTDDAADIALAFAREATGDCLRWRDGLGWLLYSNLYSYNAVEVEWKIDRIAFTVNGRRIGPVEVALPTRLHNVHPKHFRFDLTSDDPLFWIGNGYQTLPIGKFVFMEGDGLHPIKVRHGHAWQCVWMSLFTSIGISGWAQFVERFGMPIPKIDYDSGSATFGEYKQAMDDILNALGSGKGIKVPRDAGFDLSIVEQPAGGRSSDPHSAFWDACKAAKTVRVLGSELGTVTGNVGTYEGPRTGATKYNLEEWDAARLAERVGEQLISPMMQFNAENLATAANAAGFNVTPDMLIRRAPHGRQEVVREMNLQTRVDVIGKFVAMGVPVSQEAELDQFGIVRAISDEDRIPGEAISVAKGGALKTPADAADGDAENPDVAAIAETQQQAPAPAAALTQGGQPEAPDSEGEPVAHPDESLNGAQVTALLDVIRAVGVGEIPKDAAKQIIAAAFPIDEARIDKMIDPVEVKPPVNPDKPTLSGTDSTPESGQRSGPPEGKE